MVLAERNSELVRNGRRSRGPSPNNGHGGASSVGGSGGVVGIGSGGGGVAGLTNNIGGGGGGSVGIGGTGTPETSSDDDNSIKRNGKSKTKQSEYEEKIRVGRDYQAVCPALIAEIERKPEILNDRALLVWSPTKEIPDSKLEEYISVAKEKYGYNGEQALGMLFWHKHDLERAVMDLANFTPFPDEWTVEDKVLFEQAFQFHGKSFHRIRQMLPDKSIASLVKYYYSWKKTRHRQSVMDRQEKAKASKEGSENGSDNGSNEESDNDDKEQTLASGSQDQTQNHNNTKLGGGNASEPNLSKQNKTGAGGGVGDIAATSDAVDSENVATVSTTNIAGGNKQQSQQQQRQQTPPINLNTDSSSNGGGGGGGGAVASSGGLIGMGGCCSNCGVACNLLNASPHGKLCSSCHHHWRRTGNKRPTSGPYFGKRLRDRNGDRHKRKPPRGMYINHDDIIALASSNDNQDELLANIDREIVSLLSQVQLNKQNISSLKRKNSENIEDTRPPENVNRINSRWSNDELMLAVQGVRKYGKDFQTIAETIGTKTEAHVRTFYVNHRRRYNLDQMLKKHEAEKETTAAAAAAALSNATAAASSETVTNTTNINSNKKDETKTKKDLTTNTTATVTAAAAAVTGTAAVAEESDNTTSSETTVSKSTNEEVKSTSSSVNVQKDNVIMQIDLDAEQGETSPLPVITTATTTAATTTTSSTLSQPPLAKKLALTVPNQDFPKASAV